MKKILLFFVVVFLLTNIIFSKSFFQTLKDIKNVSYEIKATKSFIDNDLFKDKKIFYLNLKYTKKRRNKLILSFLPFFKGKQALDIIDEIDCSDDIYCYKDTVDTLIEYSFNLENRDEVYEKLLRLKNKIDQSSDGRLNANKDYWDDGWKAIEYYSNRDYGNAIFYAEKALPQAEEELQNLLNDPESSLDNIISLKIEIKYLYNLLATSYTYIIPPGTSEEYKYVEAREAAQRSMDKYPEVFEAAEINFYGIISRTYLFEKDVFNAEKYYELYKQTAELLGGEELIEIGKTLEIEILVLKKSFDEALTILNEFISTYTPYPNYPKLGFIMAYYNIAYINASKEQFDAAENDLTKCLEFINEPIDPENSNIPFVQDEVEYYKRLVEKFVFIKFLDENNQEIGNPKLYWVDDNLNHGLWDKAPEIQLHVEGNFEIPTGPVKNKYYDPINLIYKEKGRALLSQYYKLYYHETINGYDLYKSISGDFTLKVFEKNKDYIVVTVSTLDRKKTDKIKLIVPDWGALNPGTPYKVYCNFAYDPQDPLDDVRVFNLNNVFKIVYISFKDNNNEIISADIKIKENDNTKSVELKRVDKNKYISNWISVSNKHIPTLPAEITQITNSELNPILMLTTDNFKTFHEIKILMPAFFGMTSDPSIMDKFGYTKANYDKIIEKLKTYTLIPELSLTDDEFKKYIPCSNIIYISSHGEIDRLAKKETGKEKFIGLFLDYSSNSIIEHELIPYKVNTDDTVEIEYGVVTTPNYMPNSKVDVDFVFFDVCFSGQGITGDKISDITNDAVRGFVQKLNPKVYVGWDGIGNGVDGSDFAKLFFQYAIYGKGGERKTVKEAFREAKKGAIVSTEYKLVSFPDMMKDGSDGKFYIDTKERRL